MVLTGIVIGAVLGAWRARRQGGNARDMAQWAAVYAILFGLIGLVLTIVIGRMG